MLQVHLASTRAIGAIGAEQDRAEARVRNLTKTVLLEAQDAPPQARAAAAGPTSDLDGRLHYIAPPCPATPQPVELPSQVMDSPVPDFEGRLQLILSSLMARLSLSSPSAPAPSANPDPGPAGVLALAMSAQVLVAPKEEPPAFID